MVCSTKAVVPSSKARAFALQRWKAALAALKISTSRGYPWSDEVDTFWDWALLELLVQSGLRIEEASELTTLDILRRSLADGRIYYLLHVQELVAICEHKHVDVVQMELAEDRFQLLPRPAVPSS